MKLAVRIVRFLLEPAVGSFARAVIRIFILLGVLFGFNVSEEQLAGIMIAVEAALQAFVQIPWDRWEAMAEVEEPAEIIDENGDIVLK